jgi:hypothetical protein
MPHDRIVGIAREVKHTFISGCSRSSRSVSTRPPPAVPPPLAKERERGLETPPCIGTSERRVRRGRRRVRERKYPLSPFIQEMQKYVVVLDIYQNAASVRATMSGWLDYLHMAKWNGRWVIVNVLWEQKPPGR